MGPRSLHFLGLGFLHEQIDPPLVSFFLRVMSLNLILLTKILKCSETSPEILNNASLQKETQMQINSGDGRNLSHVPSHM